jgi:hypothetical protein
LYISLLLGSGCSQSFLGTAWDAIVKRLVAVKSNETIIDDQESEMSANQSHRNIIHFIEKPRVAGYHGQFVVPSALSGAGYPTPASPGLGRILKLRSQTTQRGGRSPYIMSRFTFCPSRTSERIRMHFVGC